LVNKMKKEEHGSGLKAHITTREYKDAESCYCLACEELGKELAASKAQPVLKITRGELRSLWIDRKTGWDFYVEVDAKLFGRAGRGDQDLVEPRPTGKAPCERLCEATAFGITIRGLKGEIERLKAEQKPLVGN
jgi:hypothetical protein